MAPMMCGRVTRIHEAFTSFITTLGTTEDTRANLCSMSNNSRIVVMASGEDLAFSSSARMVRKLAAILIADVKGYSRLMGEDEAAMRMAASLRTILALELKARSSPDAMTTIRELLLIEQRLALVSSVVPSVVMKLVNAS